MKIILPFLFAFALLSPVATAGQPLPTKAEAKKFDKADTSNDELLSPAEFSALMKVLTKAKNGGPGNVQELQDIADAFFDWFDTDNNNAIDLGEWFAARTTVPTDPTLPDIESFPGVDLSGDEFVKTGEFVKVLKDFIPAKLALEWFKIITSR